MLIRLLNLLNTKYKKLIENWILINKTFELIISAQKTIYFSLKVASLNECNHQNQLRVVADILQNSRSMEHRVAALCGYIPSG